MVRSFDGPWRDEVRGPDLSALRGENRRLEDYLDALTAPMVGLVPYGTRLEFRVETQNHLEHQIERRMSEGFGAEEATIVSIEAYGNSRELCDAFLAEWFENKARSSKLRNLGHANYVAFGRFAIAQAALTTALMLRIFAPDGGAYALPVSPAAARHVLPNPFPITDLGPGTWTLLALTMIAPMLAGISCGASIPARAGKAIYHAMGPIVIYAFVSGSLMLPLTDGILVALFQTIVWLPVGLLGARIGSALALQRRTCRGGVL